MKSNMTPKFLQSLYSQGQAAESVAHMLTIRRERRCAADKRAQSTPQDLQLWKGDLPSTCVFLDQLQERKKQDRMRTANSTKEEMN